MTLFKSRNLSDAVEDLLERERRAVLSGNLEALTRLISEKRRLMDQLARSTEHPDRLDRLRGKARRNKALLDAAARGIKSVTEQISGLRDARSPLRTYDASGSSREIRQHRSTLEKRA